MRIEELKIENIRSYGTSKVEFDDGLVLLYGDNGAGKSSLLGSIFGGLYLSNILDYIDDDLTLDSFVRRSEDSGKIQLKFSVGNEIYVVEWEIGVREKSNGERQASTKSCTLTGGSISGSVEGVKSVSKKVEELIGLSAESFVNSVYVQQGDITRMMEADDDKRKEIIDGLLGLSKIDEYIDRMNKARRELGAQKRQLGSLIEEKERQLSEAPDKDELDEEISDLVAKQNEKIDSKNKAEKLINELSDKKLDIESKVNEIEKNQSRLQTAESEFESSKTKYESRKQKVKDLKQNKKAIQMELSVIESTIESKCEEENIEVDDINDFIEDLNQEIQRIKTDIQTTRDGEISRLASEIKQNKQQKSELEDKIERTSTEIENLSEKIRDIESSRDILLNKIDDSKEEVEELDSRLKNLCEELDIDYKDDLIELRDSVIPKARNKMTERAYEIYKNMGEKSKEKKTYDELLESGECPTCGEIHESTDDFEHQHQSAIEKLDEVKSKVDNVDNFSELLSESESVINKIVDLKSDIESKIEKSEYKNQQISEKNKQIDNLKHKLVNFKSKKEEIEVKISDLKKELVKYNKKVKELNDEKDRLDDRKESITEISNKVKSAEKLDERVEDIESDIEHQKEREKDAFNQLLKSESQLEELKSQVSNEDIEELKDERKEVNKKLDKAKNLRDLAEEKLESIRNKLAEKRQTKNHLEKILSRKKELREKQETASDYESEAEDVIMTYNSVKTQLRKESLGLINKYTNEIFQSVYHSQVYQRLQIDENYKITLITGDGLEIEPKELSGGEKTIVSLAIRTGIYRLLVERNGTTDSLPPIILDEPTTYLDTSHISNLQDVIDTVTSWDVPQVFIVSHKEDMIQNADSAFKISKNPATETSTVVQEY